MFCYTELHILLKNSILTLILSFLLLSFISSELIFQKKKNYPVLYSTGCPEEVFLIIWGLSSKE